MYGLNVRAQLQSALAAVTLHLHDINQFIVIEVKVLHWHLALLFRNDIPIYIIFLERSPMLQSQYTQPTTIMLPKPLPGGRKA